jgi:predicted nucleotide-binding protein
VEKAVEATNDPVIVEQLASVIPAAQQILAGTYDPPTAMRWYMKSMYWYRRLYGPESAPFKELVALREGLAKKTADPARIRAKVNEFLALVAFLSNGAASASSVTVSRPSAPPNTRRVFVIHGHDELNTLRLQAMLKDHFSLDVIVMTAKPGQSRPIIEKFEENARYCTFAFALFTPDDLVVKSEEKYHQARPNVIFETGWFVGRLGKERVMILLKEGTKIYSDFDGVSRVHYKEDVKDVFLQIQTELSASDIF